MVQHWSNGGAGGAGLASSITGSSVEEQVVVVELVHKFQEHMELVVLVEEEWWRILLVIFRNCWWC
jgi:hypothetical protein